MQPLRGLPIVVGWLVAGIAGPVWAANVLVSGQTLMVIVDGNGDGPGPGDCVFTATVDPPSLTFTSFASISTQDTTTPVRSCGGTANGSVYINQDSSSDFVDVTINNASNPPPTGQEWPLTGLFHAPVIVDTFEEFFTGSPNGLPIAPNTIEVQDPANPDNLRASMQICSSGSPAVKVNAAGTAFLLTVPLYPNAQNPTHVKIPSIPLEKVGGGTAILDAYIPVVDRAITVAFDNDPSALIVDLKLNNLRPCGAGGSGRPAPTLTNGALIVIALALLALGVWRVGRRRGFYEGFPTL